VSKTVSKKKSRKKKKNQTKKMKRPRKQQLKSIDKEAQEIVEPSLSIAGDK
jgi:hypothetical protein